MSGNIISTATVLLSLFLLLFAIDQQTCRHGSTSGRHVHVVRNDRRWFVESRRKTRRDQRDSVQGVYARTQPTEDEGRVAVRRVRVQPVPGQRGQHTDVFGRYPGDVGRSYTQGPDDARVGLHQTV